MTDTLGQILSIVAVVALVCVVIAVIGLTLLVRSIRRINVPHDADFFTTMRMVPLSLVILLDLLDLGLDIFATPLVWLFLDRMGLPNLRNKAVIEALIPFSGPIPTFTLTWLAARMFNLGNAEMQAAVQLSKHARPQIIDLDASSVSRYNDRRIEANDTQR